MSLIYQAEIDKAKLLVDGIKQNRSFLEEKGFDVSVAERLEQNLEELTHDGEALNLEEKTLSQHRKQCHWILDHLKQDISSSKTQIKKMFDESQWIKFGVPDKR